MLKKRRRADEARRRQLLKRYHFTRRSRPGSINQEPLQCFTKGSSTVCHPTNITAARHAVLDSRLGRLSRIADYAAALALEGVDPVDAYEMLDELICTEAAPRADRASHRRARSVARRRAVYAFHRAPDVRETAEFRARGAAADLLQKLPAQATIADLAHAIRANFPLVRPGVAAKIADGVVSVLARPPIAQRGPHPTEIFETVTIEPDERALALHGRALEMMRRG